MYFRLLSRNDFHDYMELINEFRPTKLSRSKFSLLYSEIFAHSQIWVLIDEETKKIIGTGTLWIEQKFIHNGGKVAHIEDIIIKQSEKGKGYGKLLIEFLVEKSREKKSYKVVLDCSQELTKFYEKCGFSLKNFQMEIRDSDS